MQVVASNSMSAAKFALKYVFGTAGKKRPKFLTIESERVITLRGDTEDFSVSFEELNHDYVDKLYLEDISVFNDYEFGKFFLEYGRCLFANLIVCLTKSDWDAANNRDNIDTPFIAEYFDELLKLDDKLDQVMSAYTSALALTEKVATNPVVDFSRPSWLIREYKKAVGMYSAADMRNTIILSIVYLAAWFSLTGSTLILGKEAGFDGLDLVDQRKTLEYDKLTSAILNMSRDDDSKSRYLTMLLVFDATREMYRNFSGLSYEDPRIESTGLFCAAVEKKVMDTDSTGFIDEELITGFADSGVTLGRFAKRYNPLKDVLALRADGLIQNDITNFWEFGKEYFRCYFSPATETNPDTEITQIVDVSYPAMFGYLKGLVDGTNEEVESGFGYIKNIVTGLENEKLSEVDPGLILQLTLIAASFRTIEKGKTSELSAENKDKLSAGIDLVDTIISVLYKMWFTSGKFFTQVSRPAYCEDTCLSTLGLLKAEILDIIQTYFEFVRYGVTNSGTIYSSDKLLFSTYILDKYVREYDGSLSAIVERQFPTVDKDVLIRESGSHGSRSFVYAALCAEINQGLSVDSLVEYATKAELPGKIVKTLAQKQVDEYTGIEILDRVISAFSVIQGTIQSNPEYFMLAVYAVMFDVIDDIFEKNNVGHYFEFAKPENAISGYRIESIVSEMVKKPIQAYSVMAEL